MFPLPYRVNLTDLIFLKRIIHWLPVLFLPMLIFLNMMNSQSDKTGILDVLEITFLQPKHGGQPLTDFLISFSGFYLLLVVSLQLSWEKQNLSKLLILPLPEIHKNLLEEMRNFKKYIIHKSCLQLDNFFILIVTNTLNSHVF